MFNTAARTSYCVFDYVWMPAFIYQLLFACCRTSIYPALVFDVIILRISFVCCSIPGYILQVHNCIDRHIRQKQYSSEFYPKMSVAVLSKTVKKKSTVGISPREVRSLIGTLNDSTSCITCPT